MALPSLPDYLTAYAPEDGLGYRVAYAQGASTVDTWEQAVKVALWASGLAVGNYVLVVNGAGQHVAHVSPQGALHPLVHGLGRTDRA